MIVFWSMNVIAKIIIGCCCCCCWWWWSCFFCACVCLYKSSVYFLVHVCLSISAYLILPPFWWIHESMCQKSHELTRRLSHQLLSNEVTSSSPRHSYRCISYGFRQGWNDHSTYSTSTRIKRATVDLRLLDMPANVDVPSLDQRLVGDANIDIFPENCWVAG